MSNLQTDNLYCKNCNKAVKQYHRFCYNCGSNLVYNNKRINFYNDANLQSALTFFCIYLFVCAIVHFTNLFNAYSKLFWIEILIAVITLLYVQKNFKSIKPLLKFYNFSFLKLTGCIVMAVIAAIIVNLIVFKFNVSFFKVDAGYYNRYHIYKMPALLMMYSIAVNPALFEELAFRGVMYNYLKNSLDEQLVVIVTAFMFAIVHLNLISLFWLIPFGIFVGYMRKKTGTLWYGIIFHFIFNLVAVLFDLQLNGYFR